MFVTSLRDGMNLVSFEYIACQEKNRGVLVLSEFAGAAQALALHSPPDPTPGPQRQPEPGPQPQP